MGGAWRQLQCFSDEYADRRAHADNIIHEYGRRTRALARLYWGAGLFGQHRRVAAYPYPTIAIPQQASSGGGKASLGSRGEVEGGAHQGAGVAVLGGGHHPLGRADRDEGGFDQPPALACTCRKPVYLEPFLDDLAIESRDRPSGAGETADDLRAFGAEKCPHPLRPGHVNGADAEDGRGRHGELDFGALLCYFSNQ